MGHSGMVLSDDTVLVIGPGSDVWKSGDGGVTLSLATADAGWGCKLTLSRLLYTIYLLDTLEILFFPLHL